MTLAADSAPALTAALGGTLIGVAMNDHGSEPLFHVVLHEPEIPNNTGNVGRTCVATGCALHLIRPLGFDTSEKACRRAGLDYWPRLAPKIHDSWEAYLESQRPAADRLWLLTTKAAGAGAGHRSGSGCLPVVWRAALQAGDHLVFGKETKGLPVDLLAKHAARLLMLPMMPGERSLNLATAVCAVVYEGIRQLESRGQIVVDEAGRIVLGQAGGESQGAAAVRGG